MKVPIVENVSAKQFGADPSQPNDLGLIRPLADFGGQAVQIVRERRVRRQTEARLDE
jgi:hypothetical protein